MSPLHYHAIADTPMTVLDMTSLTIEEFDLLVPRLEAAFQAHMAVWRLDGKPTRCTHVCNLQELPTAHTARPPLVRVGVSKNQPIASGSWGDVWLATGQDEPMASPVAAASSNRTPHEWTRTISFASRPC